MIQFCFFCVKLILVLWKSVSNDTVQLCSVVKSSVDHAKWRNFCQIFFLFVEKNSVIFDFPYNSIFIVVICDELHEHFTIVNHEHFLHISEGQAGVCSFSRSSNFISDCICKFVNEEVIKLERHIVLLLQNSTVWALNKEVFKRNRDPDVQITW